MKKSLSIYKTVLNPVLFWTGFVFIGLLSTSSANQKKEEKFATCFFELDNTVTSDNFQNKSGNAVGINRFPTREHVNACKKMIQSGKQNGSDNRRRITACLFEKMIQSGQRCDGLTLSSHHAGDWWGKKGVLMLKDMEALSCNSKYKGWFKNVKALWLDGCNTVTDNFIKSRGIIKTADSETVRVVGKKEDKTKLNRRYMGDYQQSYAGSLDENTPLSSRYLRMFPNTQIYGFNGAAPAGAGKGDKKEEGQVGSQSFIHEHLTNLGEALKAEKEWKSIKKDFTRGLTALFSDDPCDEKKIKAWESVSSQARFEAVEHQDYKKEYKLGCNLILAKQVLDNPNSTEAQKALAEKIIQDHKEAENILNYPGSTEAQKASAKEMIQNREALKLANDILNKSNSKKAVELAKLSILKTLKIINKKDQSSSKLDQQYSHLLFNNIYDTWRTAKSYKAKDSKFFNNVKSEFTTNSFTKSLKERIKSPYTASLRKGDYIKFYTEVHDVNIRKLRKKDQFIKEEIDHLLGKAQIVFKDLQSPTAIAKGEKLDTDTKRALAVSVVDQLSQYDLLSKAQIKELMKNQNLFPKDSDNPFILDTRTKLRFTINNNEIIPTVAKAKEHSIDPEEELSGWGQVSI